MSRSYNVLGPYMSYPSGNNSPYRLYDENGFQTGVSRKKPKDLLTSMTTLSAYHNQRSGAYVWVPSLNGSYPTYAFDSVSGNTSSYTHMATTARNQAASKLRMALKDQVWNAAQTFAELGKTMSFFIDASRDMLHAYRLAKRGDVLGLSELYRSHDYRGKRRRPPYVRVANRWLQWRYAVRPLVWDLQDMLEEHFRSDAEPAVKRFGSSAKTELNTILWEGKLYNLPSFKSASVTVKCRYTSYVRLSVDSNTWKRLGLTNGLSLLWELTPGSFLLDWWCPVGEYLSGLDAAIGVTNIATCSSEQYLVEEKFSIGGAVQTARSKQYSRSSGGIPSQPLPTLRTSNYDLKNRTLDAIALLTQAVHSRSVKRGRG